MIRHGRRYKPVLLGSETKTPYDTGTLEGIGKSYEYTVEVRYTDYTGFPVVWRGNFTAGDMVKASDRGREFVTKYLRPQLISHVAVVSAAFDFVSDAPIPISGIHANEVGSDTAEFTGALGSLLLYANMAASEIGTDTAAFSGVLLDLSIEASLNAQETGSDTAAGSGIVHPTEIVLTATEVGSDTSAVTGEITLTGGALVILNDDDGVGLDVEGTPPIAVKVGGYISAYYDTPSRFFVNSSNTPKIVYDAAGAAVYSPHNMAIQSQSFDSTSWTKTGTLTAVTVDAINAPDGTLTADKIACTGTTTAQHSVIPTAGIAVVNGDIYTAAIRAKAGELSWLGFAPINSSSNKTYFNLGSGTVGTLNAAHLSANMTSLGDGWYLCSIVYQSASSTSQPTFYLQTADLQGTMTGVVGNGLYLWGAQVNRGSGVVEYMPTTTVARYGIAVDYDPVTHALAGILGEPTTINLLLNNTTLSTQSPTVTAVPHTLSFWGTGSVTLTGASTAGPLVGTGASDRVTLTFTPTAGSLTCTVAGTVTNAQLEANPYPTTLIRTFGSTATRSNDGYSVPVANWPFNAAGPNSVVLHSTPKQVANAIYMSVHNGTDTDRFSLDTSSGTKQARLLAIQGGTTYADIPSTVVAPVAGTLYKIAYTMAANDVAICVNGGTVTVDTSVTMPAAATTVHICGSRTSGGRNMLLKKMKIVPVRLPDATMQAETT